jgi:hypothetical protein
LDQFVTRVFAFVLMLLCHFPAIAGGMLPDIVFATPNTVTGGAVAFDANATSVASGNSASPFTNGNLTIGAGSNRCLIVTAGFFGAVSAVSATWNGGANMFAIGNAVNAGGGTIWMFGMVAPASGNHTISVSWTGTAQFLAVNGVSFTGCNQTGGATTFINATTNTGASPPPSLTVTTPANDISVDLVGGNSGAPSAPTQTVLYTDAANSFTGSSYGTTGSFSWTVPVGSWAEVGVAIAHN